MTLSDRDDPLSPACFPVCLPLANVGRFPESHQSTRVSRPLIHPVRSTTPDDAIVISSGSESDLSPSSSRAPLANPPVVTSESIFSHMSTEALLEDAEAFLDFGRATGHTLHALLLVARWRLPTLLQCRPRTSWWPSRALLTIPRMTGEKTRR